MNMNGSGKLTFPMKDGDFLRRFVFGASALAEGKR